MTEEKYKNYDDLPMFLNAQIIASVLGVSPSSAYELLHEKVSGITDRKPFCGPAR